MNTYSEYQKTFKYPEDSKNWPYGAKKDGDGIRLGVWVTYTNNPSLFDTDIPVVIFDSEIAALRYAVRDVSRIFKVVFVPFGAPLADYLK